jgi:hypothetical protein
LQKGRRTYMNGPTVLLRLVHFHSGMAEGEGPGGVEERLSINHIADRIRSRKVGTSGRVGEKNFLEALWRLCEMT